jgi:hypothetical protein
MQQTVRKVEILFVNNSKELNHGVKFRSADIKYAGIEDLAVEELEHLMFELQRKVGEYRLQRELIEYELLWNTQT